MDIILAGSGCPEGWSWASILILIFLLNGVVVLATRKVRSLPINKTVELGPPPPASSEDALQRMRLQKQQDTEPEIELRSALHGLGYRYRVNIEPVPGLRSRADMVFSKAKVAVFVDGCFWHSCPTHGTQPKQNADWWEAKLAANRSRDEQINERLRKQGWTVIRVWEHEDPARAASRVSKVLDKRYAREEAQ